MKSHVQQNTRTKPAKTKTQKVHDYSWELLGRLRISIREGRREEIAEEVRLAFYQVIKYDFNKLASEFAGFLHYFYLFNGQKRNGYKYGRLREKYNQLANIENIVEKAFVEMSYKLNNSRSPSRALRRELNQLCQELKPYLKFQSAPISIFIYELLIPNAGLKNDVSEVIKLSKEIIDLLESKEFENVSHFYKNLAIAQMVNKDFEGASTSIQLAIGSVTKGSYPSILFTYYQFVLEIHRENYEYAYRLFHIANEKKQTNRAMLEQWKIVKGYLNFLSRCDKMDNTPIFRLGKFLNDVPVFSQDKEGNNINILILKIILNLGVKNGVIIDNHESISKYVKNHLRPHKRSQLFMKMLLQLVNCDFNSTKLKARTNKLFAELKNTSITMRDFGIEIIPYESLWPMVLSRLEKK